MKKLLIFTLLLLICTRLSEAQTSVADSLSFGGEMRYYTIYSPKNYIPGSSRPLIIHLHGYSSNGLIEQIYTNYMPVADTAGFFVVYPEGTIDAKGNRYWNAGIPGIPTTPDDIGFLSVLIDSLHRRNNIDLNHVYASGLSNGGYMCYQLAWQLANKIAAIASVSGSMTHLNFAKCTPTLPVPVMEIHGTADSVVPYDGSLIATNIDSLMRFWVLADGCFPISDPVALPNIDPNDGSTVLHFAWGAEVKNTTCELYRIIGGGHVDWPGAFGTGNNMDFSASATIWQFFNRYTHQALAVPDEKPAASASFYPNPCSKIIHISTDIPANVIIRDMTGRTIRTGNEKNIDISEMTPGFYEVIIESRSSRKIEKLIKY